MLQWGLYVKKTLDKAMKRQYNKDVALPYRRSAPHLQKKKN
jgi:hypothetical protein